MIRNRPFCFNPHFPSILKRLCIYGILYRSLQLYRVVFAVVFLSIISSYHPAYAVRPFITDDARVTTEHAFLTEGSLRIDENRFQNLMLFALGIADKLEGTIGFTDGFLRHGEEAYSIAGPLLQIKYLFTDQKGYVPAAGAVVGATPPWGAGNRDFAPSGWSEFGYLVISRSFSTHPERLNLHLNIGGTITHETGNRAEADLTWGAGLQFVIFPDIIFGLAELASGDPYGVSSGSVYQVGLRFFISEQLQIDASFGAGAWGNPLPGWFAGCGVRYCTGPLW